jgi:hypothetical protein
LARRQATDSSVDTATQNGISEDVTNNLLGETTDAPMEMSRAIGTDPYDGMTDAEIDGIADHQTMSDGIPTADKVTKRAALYMTSPHMTYGERTRLNALSAANVYAIEVAKTGRGILDEAATIKRADVYLKFLRGE